MPIKAMPTKLRLLVVATLVTVCSVSLADEPTVRHAATKAAIRKYQAKITGLNTILERETKRIQGLHDAEFQRATDQYVSDLKAAMKIALERPDLKEANAIDALIKSAGTVPPRPAEQEVAPQAGDHNTVNPAIPRGAVEFEGNYYFVFASRPLKWGDATRLCYALGGHPAYIESAKENAFVAQEASRRRVEGVLIGGTDRKTEGKWLFGDRVPMTYHNFARGTLIGDGNDHIRVIVDPESNNYGKWVGANNVAAFPFVCEWEGSKK